MGLASYEIVGGAGEWRVSHDGKAENVYETKESAFEAAEAAAALALRATQTQERQRQRPYGQQDCLCDSEHRWQVASHTD